MFRTVNKASLKFATKRDVVTQNLTFTLNAVSYISSGVRSSVLGRRCFCRRNVNTFSLSGPILLHSNLINIVPDTVGKWWTRWSRKRVEHTGENLCVYLDVFKVFKQDTWRCILARVSTHVCYDLTVGGLLILLQI